MIKSIKWNNHNILGNLELNFTKEDGSTYNTIVLAGENGTGKTTILDTIATFLNLESIEPFEHIIYEIDNETYIITPNDTNSKIGFHKRKKLSDGIEKNITSNRNIDFNSIKNDHEDIRHYGCVYSKARSGFKTDKVTSTTTQQLDDNKYEDDSTDNYTDIKHLIIDIQTQDNEDWMEMSVTGTAPDIDTFLESSKSSRFRKAFNNFFDSMRYKKINSAQDELQILFEKHNNEIPLDNLSTGEKQIVFRGAHLLKNSNNLQNGIVLIDEPELSLHPKWQKKILKYYRDLFSNNSVQSTQIIFSTHSEYVIREALEDDENVLVIILEDNEGTITSIPTREKVLPTLTAAEINYLAFGILSVDYHIALYSRIQTIEQLHRIYDCDEFISNHRKYNSNIHEKIDNSSYGNYSTLPTYIRNAIDHPDSGRRYYPEDISKSIELLREICADYI